jgi:hypothetical protein
LYENTAITTQVIMKRGVMKKNIVSALCVLSLVLVACGSAQEKSGAPSKMDSMFSSTAPGTFPAGKKFIQPAAWAVGQYVVMGTIEKGKKKSVMRYSIVGKADGGFIFEMVVTTDKEENVMQYLLKGIDKAMKSGKPGDIEIAWIKVRGSDGKIQVIDGAMMSLYKPMLSSSTSNAGVKMNVFTDGGTIVVPAGSFTGVNVVETESKTLGFTTKSKGFYHSAVPITGMVRSITEDGKTEMVLIAFGTTGAKPVIPLK